MICLLLFRRIEEMDGVVRKMRDFYGLWRFGLDTWVGIGFSRRLSFWGQAWVGNGYIKGRAFTMLRNAAFTRQPDRRGRLFLRSD